MGTSVEHLIPSRVVPVVVTGSVQKMGRPAWGLPYVRQYQEASLAAVTRRSRQWLMVLLMRRWHADVGGDRGRECDAKIELKAANSRVRRFFDAKARQLGIGKLVCRGVEGTVCSDGASIASQMSVGGGAEKRLERMTTGSSDTNGLQPCCALFLATQLDEAANHETASVAIVCFSRVAPAPDGRRLTHSTVGPCPLNAGNGDDETGGLPHSPTLAPCIASRITERALSRDSLCRKKMSGSGRKGNPGRR